MAGFNLLRSLPEARSLRSLDRWHGATDLLLPHGCGYPISLGCPNFGIDWAVEHRDGRTTIRDAHLVDAVVGRPLPRYSIEISTEDYRTEVVEFASAARAFYFSSERKTVPADDRDMHRSFWHEYDARLELANQIGRPIPGR